MISTVPPARVAMLCRTDWLLPKIYVRGQSHLARIKSLIRLYMVMLIDALHQSDVPIPCHKPAKLSVHLSQSLSNLWCPVFMSIAMGHWSTSTALLTLPEKINAPLRTSHADILSARRGTQPGIDSADVSMPKNTRSHRRVKKRSFLEKANGEA